MTVATVRAANRLATCRRKRRYSDWETARLAGLQVWRENPRPTDANLPLPYRCDLEGESHYHVGHGCPRPPSLAPTLGVAP